MQLQISRARLRGTSENVIVGFKSCLAIWAVLDRDIFGLRELEFMRVGGLSVMDELEPLVKAAPFEHFQMAFVTIPVNP